MSCKLSSMNIKSVHGGNYETQILEKVNLEVEITRVLTIQQKIPQQKVIKKWWKENKRRKKEKEKQAKK